MRLVIATNNAGKRREIIAYLQGMPFEILPASETQRLSVIEDGRTFAENARKKARAFARAHGCLALADDSGLCVDALDGAPGIHSARFAGEHANDEQNNAHLLRCLHGIKQRQAHFVCCLCLSTPEEHELCEVQGETHGQILHAADGEQGFGYDPLFFSDELGKSFARASSEEKARVSHRGRALQRLRDYLRKNPPWTK